MRNISIIAASLAAIATPAAAQETSASTSEMVLIPPCCSIPVPAIDIARCTETALADNGIDEQAARRMQIGTTVRVLGTTAVLYKGGTLWDLCATELLNSRLEAIIAMQELELQYLIERTDELERMADEVNRADR